VTSSHAIFFTAWRTLPVTAPLGCGAKGSLRGDSKTSKLHKAALSVWAIETSTGATLWTYPAGHIIHSGGAIVDGGFLIGNIIRVRILPFFTPGGK
jgi:hypothetical protein